MHAGTVFHTLTGPSRNDRWQRPDDLYRHRDRGAVGDADGGRPRRQCDAEPHGQRHLRRSDDERHQFDGQRQPDESSGRWLHDDHHYRDPARPGDHRAADRGRHRHADSGERTCQRPADEPQYDERAGRRHLHGHRCHCRSGDVHRKGHDHEHGALEYRHGDVRHPHRFGLAVHCRGSKDSPRSGGNHGRGHPALVARQSREPGRPSVSRRARQRQSSARRPQRRQARSAKCPSPRRTLSRSPSSWWRRTRRTGSPWHRSRRWPSGPRPPGDRLERHSLAHHDSGGRETETWSRSPWTIILERPCRGRRSRWGFSAGGRPSPPDRRWRHRDRWRHQQQRCCGVWGRRHACRSSHVHRDRHHWQRGPEPDRLSHVHSRTGRSSCLRDDGDGVSGQSPSRWLYALDGHGDSDRLLLEPHRGQDDRAQGAEWKLIAHPGDRCDRPERTGYLHGDWRYRWSRDYQATDTTDSSAVLDAEAVVTFGNPPVPPPDAQTVRWWPIPPAWRPTARTLRHHRSPLRRERRCRHGKSGDTGRVERHFQCDGHQCDDWRHWNGNVCGRDTTAEVRQVRRHWHNRQRPSDNHSGHGDIYGCGRRFHNDVDDHHIALGRHDHHDRDERRGVGREFGRIGSQRDHRQYRGWVNITLACHHRGKPNLVVACWAWHCAARGRHHRTPPRLKRKGSGHWKRWSLTRNVGSCDEWPVTSLGYPWPALRSQQRQEWPERCDTRPDDHARPYHDGQRISVSVGPNHYFKPYSRINIIESTDRGATAKNLPTSILACDGNTIQGNTILVQHDGSFSEHGYLVYALPTHHSWGKGRRPAHLQREARPRVLRRAEPGAAHRPQDLGASLHGLEVGSSFMSKVASRRTGRSSGGRPLRVRRAVDSGRHSRTTCWCECSSSLNVSPQGNYHDGQTISIAVAPNGYFRPERASQRHQMCRSGRTRVQSSQGHHNMRREHYQGARSWSLRRELSLTGYAMYRCPAFAREQANFQPICNQTNFCVLYVGQNQNDFTAPKVFSAPFWSPEFGVRHDVDEYSFEHEFQLDGGPELCSQAGVSLAPSDGSTRRSCQYRRPRRHQVGFVWGRAASLRWIRSEAGTSRSPMSILAPGLGTSRPAFDDDVPIDLTKKPVGADRVFNGVLAGSSALVLLLLVAVVVFLVPGGGRPCDSAASPYVDQTWSPDTITSGWWPSWWARRPSLFSRWPSPRPSPLQRPWWSTNPRRVDPSWLTGVIDLLATVPSIVYGFWGLQLVSLQAAPARWLVHHASFVPIFRTPSPDRTWSRSSPVGWSARSRSFRSSLRSAERWWRRRRGTCEAALGLGGTRWGMVTDVILPFSRNGILGAILLGFGRGLGETMIVALVLSQGNHLTTALMGPGGLGAIAARDHGWFSSASPDREERARPAGTRAVHDHTGDQPRGPGGRCSIERRHAVTQASKRWADLRGRVPTGRGGWVRCRVPRSSRWADRPLRPALVWLSFTLTGIPGRWGSPFAFSPVHGRLRVDVLAAYGVLAMKDRLATSPSGSGPLRRSSRWPRCPLRDVQGLIGGVRSFPHFFSADLTG